MNTFFDRIVIANLPARTDRLAAATAQFTSSNWPFIAPQVCPSVTAIPGTFGNLQTQSLILSQNAGAAALLILEDDFLLCQDFPSVSAAFLAAVPADWDGLMLGGNHCRAPIPVSAGVVRCLKASETHAYAVRGKLLAALAALYAAGTTSPGTIWPTVQGAFKVYAPSPWLIGQAAGKSDLTGRVMRERFYNRRGPLLNSRGRKMPGWPKRLTPSV